MTKSYSPTRMSRVLPGLFKVTSEQTVDPTFYAPKSAAIFRPYHWDSTERFYYTEQGKTVSLARTADDVVDAIYGKALQVAADAGEVADTGIDVDADLGASFTLSFVIHPLWDKQPTAASAFHPFRHATSPNPRLGYVENTGTIEAAGWYGRTSGVEKSLTYALGWKPRTLIAVSLVVDDTAGTTKLYVNGVERASLTEAVKANVSGTLRIHRATTQSGTTGKTNLEGYFLHAKALSATEVETLHKMFTSGITQESRWVRTFMALGLAFADIEEHAWNLHVYRQINNATGGALTNLGKDYSVNRKAGESDADLRPRIKNRLLELFSEATPNQLLEVVSGATGLTKDELVLRLNKDASDNDKHAYFSLQLPPGYESKVTDADNVLKAAKAAGIEHQVGTSGSLTWDTANKGWDLGAWNYLR